MAWKFFGIDLNYVFPCCRLSAGLEKLEHAAASVDKMQKELSEA